jgi:hypothetical protein
MIRRIPFTIDTKTSLYNYQQAVQTLNGPDTGGTKLWWDKNNKPNISIIQRHLKSQI